MSANLQVVPMILPIIVHATDKPHLCINLISLVAH